MNKTTRIIRSEEITIDAHIFTVLAGGRNPGEIYFAAIAPDMELTVVKEEEMFNILPCFDALFNTKASEALQEGIDIDFRVNDLSTLPFEAADMVVLLSNLLDNAIEANRLYRGDKKIYVTALWKSSFLFSM